MQSLSVNVSKIDPSSNAPNSKCESVIIEKSFEELNNFNAMVFFLLMNLLLIIKCISDL